MSKDFAKSFQQKSWEFAVKVYPIYKKHAETFPEKEFWKNAVERLEKKYPQLKESK